MTLYTLDNVSIATFDKVSKTGNVRHLSRWPLPKWFLARQWDKLMSQFVAEIGLSKSTMAYYRQMRQWARFVIQALDGKKDYWINAKMARIEAQKYLESNGNGNLIHSVAVVAKMQGYHLKPNQLSIREYFELTKMLKQYGKAAKS